MLKNFLRAIAVKLAKGLTKIGYIPPERIFKHLHFVGPFSVELPNKVRLSLYSWGNRVENELAWRGWNGHEPVERARWLQMVSESGDVLDVGANTATFALMAKAESPESRVTAFEPVSRIADRAAKNVEVSGLDVDVVKAAVSDADGELPIFDPGGANAYSASLEEDFLDGQKDSYLVPVVSLDSFCRETGCDPVAIKIDVEGSEAKVLLGASEILARRKATILCEWLGNSGAHGTASELLTKMGYSAVNIDDLSEFDFSTARLFDDRNILIVPTENLPKIRSDWASLT